MTLILCLVMPWGEEYCGAGSAGLLIPGSAPTEVWSEAD